MILRYFDAKTFDKQGDSDAHSSFDDFGDICGFDGRSGHGPDLRRERSDLPAQVVLGRRQHLLLRICLDGPVPSDGIGPSGYVR